MTCLVCNRSHWVWELDDPAWSCPCGAPVNSETVNANLVEKMWYLSPPFARVMMAVVAVVICSALTIELIYAVLT